MPVEKKLSAQTLPVIESSEIVAESKLFKIEQLQLTFSNGNKRIYERMKGSGRGAVMIVAMKNKDEFYLVNEYGAGTHSYQLGFPKGLIDPGETPEKAANRELQEEIGFGARHFVKLKTVTLAPSYFSAQMHIYLAYDLYESQLEGDEPEPLQRVECDWSEVNELIDSDALSEARSITALLLAQAKVKDMVWK
jgi:ADP-ribose diphosphatase